MKFFDIIRMSITNLFKRFLRTFMTVSGVIIGTCAIIVMVSIGTGLDRSFQESLESMADLTMITIYGINNPEIPPDVPQKMDAKALAFLGSLPNVRSVTPQVSGDTSRISIYTDDHEYVYIGNITGVNLAEFNDFGLTLNSGAFPDKTQLLDSVVISEQAIYSLRKMETYDYIPMWDETYTNMLPPPFDISTLSFKISPFYVPPEKRGQNQGGGSGYMSMGGGMMYYEDDFEEEMDVDLLEYFDKQDLVDEYEKSMVVSGTIKYDDRYWELTSGILMDISLLNEILSDYHKLNAVEGDYSPLEFQQISLRVNDMDNVEEVEQYLKENYYNFWSYNEYRQQMQQQNLMIQLVLGGLAAISLFVAAIGIFNTMVMAITERTKEIGVMKVLGCSLGDIRLMFLFESGAIGLMGGIFGTGLSFLISFLLNTVASGLLEGFLGGMPTGEGGSNISVIEPNLILFALAFSMAIGLISGFLPANRATKISALEAINQ